MEDFRPSFAKWARPGQEYRLRVIRHIFRKKDIEGKSVLDLGAGCGETSGAFIIEFGAKQAMAVDSYEGHGSEVTTYDEITGLKEILGSKLNVNKCDVWDFQTPERFGFILNINSLHHIAESKVPLKEDRELYERVVGLFRKVGSWLDKNGKFVVFEVARRNFSPIPRYRKRFREIVDLSSKQDPWTWTSAMKDAGFRKVRVRYPAPVVLDRFRFLHPLFNNYLMCVLTGSGYMIEASGFDNSLSGC